jgi:prepilin-type N-terminal cleavage/methylation domain-containing protein
VPDKIDAEQRVLMEKAAIEKTRNPILLRLLRGKRRMNPKGFTLVEILIGIILLSVGLLAVGGMQITSIRGNFSSYSLTYASYVAQDRMEFLSHLNFDDVLLNAGNHGDGSASNEGISYNRTYNVAINGGQKTITYTVTWQDRVNRQISFSTIRSQ